MNLSGIITAALAAIAVAGCAQRPSGEEAGQLRTGDLIFVGIPADYSLDSDSMASAIGEATGEADSLNIIHVAIAEVRQDSVWIIDATIAHGVDRHPLDTFLTDFTLRDGSYPTFKVMRLKDDSQAQSFVENAKKFLGQPYDSAFLPGNGAKYCSELVRDSYVTPDGGYIFSESPMNFENSAGEMPVYWEQLFGRLGMEVPQGVMGTNPKQMSEEPVLEAVELDFPQD